MCLKNLFIDVLGPKEKISSFEDYLSEYLVYTSKLFPKVCHTQNYEKQWPMGFFHWETILSKKLSFQQPNMCYRNDPITSTVFVKVHQVS